MNRDRTEEESTQRGAGTSQPGGPRKRVIGTRGVQIVGAMIAVATAALGFLFWPLWFVTAISVAYLILGAFAEKKA